MTDPTRQPESEANTPSVPDSAALAQKLFDYMVLCSHKSGLLCNCKVFMAEELTAFGRAQYERGRKDGWDACCESGYGDEVVYRRGFSSGIEKAAEVAATLTSHDNHIHVYSTAEVIQKRILSLLPKEGAKG